MTLRISTWTMQRVADATGGEVRGASGATATSVSTDTRKISPGALFVALVGDRFDGHDYVASAVDAGAGAVMVSRPVETTVPQIIVADTLQGIQALGRAIFADAKRDGLYTVALTGSNGKTTTKELMAALWGTLGRVHATAGNFNNHIGVPLTLCALPVDAQFAIIEMGANAPGDIELLISLAPTDVRVITSIGAAHIEGFGGLDGVRRAKSEIFGTVASPGRLAVHPASESFATGTPTLTVGDTESGADVRWRKSDDGLVVWGEGFEYRLNLPLPGAHNAQNLATAVATLVGSKYDLDEDAANVALEHLRMPGGRWRRVEAAGWTFLDDAYNANPSSVQASWDTFVEIAGAEGAVPAEVTAVIGEMFELGPQAEQFHRETARWVVERGGAETYIFVGSHAEAMVDEARGATKAELAAFAEPLDAAQWLRERPSRTIYLKASRGQKLETIIDKVTGE